MNQRLKILHVMLSRGLAGAERYCADLANLQARAGHEVHLLTKAGARVLSIVEPSVQLHSVRSSLWASWVSRSLVARHAIDVAHAHLSHACKALRSPCAALRVASLHVGYKAHQHRFLDALICLNPEQASELVDFPGVATVVPNWMPSARLPYRPTGLSLRQQHGIDPQALMLISVGRLHPSKSLDSLIRAFKASAPAQAVLCLVGEGPQRADLERLAQEDARIRFVGYQEDVMAWLREADLFVSASQEETFGLAILEAMHAGLEVITTATAGPRHFLRDQAIGMVPIGDEKALRASLEAWFIRVAQQGVQRMRYDLREFDPHVAQVRMAAAYAEARAQMAPLRPLWAA